VKFEDNNVTLNIDLYDDYLLLWITCNGYANILYWHCVLSFYYFFIFIILLPPCKFTTITYIEYLLTVSCYSCCVVVIINRCTYGYI